MNGQTFMMLARARSASEKKIREATFAKSTQTNVFVPFIETFVYDKGGRCLKSEIIKEIYESPENLKRRMEINDIIEMIDSFESGLVYGKSLTFEKSKRSDRIIYKYTEESPIEDLLNMDDLTGMFKAGAKIDSCFNVSEEKVNPTFTRWPRKRRDLRRRRTSIKNENVAIRSTRQGICYPGQ